MSKDAVGFWCGCCNTFVHKSSVEHGVHMCHGESRCAPAYWDQWSWKCSSCGAIDGNRMNHDTCAHCGKVKNT